MYPHNTLLVKVYTAYWTPAIIFDALSYDRAQLSDIQRVRLSVRLSVRQVKDHARRFKKLSLNFWGTGFSASAH